MNCLTYHVLILELKNGLFSISFFLWHLYVLRGKIEKKKLWFSHKQNRQRHWLSAFPMLYPSLFHISRWLLTTHDARNCVVVLHCVYMHAPFACVCVCVRGMLSFHVGFYISLPSYATFKTHSYTPVSFIECNRFLRGGKLNARVCVYVLVFDIRFSKLYLYSPHTYKCIHTFFSFQ